MAETTGIAWTRSTFNAWIGCTKVGPGCDACYAEALDARFRYGGATHWGDDRPRYRTSAAIWRGPLRWNALAGLERERGEIAVQEKARQAPAAPWHTPGFWPVFCCSLADVFDNKAPDTWRRDLWELIERTPNLSWLLVTKRIGNVERMVPARWMVDGFPRHVRILATIVNQDEAERDVPKLLMLPARNGISYEPALGPVDWTPWLEAQCDHGSVPAPGGGKPCPRCMGNTGHYSCPGLEWIIVGGESAQAGHIPRLFDLEWARSTIAQCKEAGVPVFVKQLGSKPIKDPRTDPRGEGAFLWLQDRAGADPDEWPGYLQIQEFPQ